MNKILRIMLLSLFVFSLNCISAQQSVTAITSTGESKVVLIDYLGDDSLKPPPPYDEFAKFVRKDSGIKLVYPKGYVDLNARTMTWRPDMTTEKKRFIAEKYRHQLKAVDGSHLILVPLLDMTRRTPLGGNLAYLVRAELNEALVLNGGNKIDNVKAHSVKFDESQLRAKVNADVVYVTHFKLAEPFNGEYGYCMAFYAFKNDQIPVFIKCFFKNDSASEREAVLHSVLSNMFKYPQARPSMEPSEVKKRAKRYDKFHKKYETGSWRS